jgi:hypothetical protein
MKARTVSAIQTEALYLRHRIERLTQALSMTADVGNAAVLNADILADRRALARCERELGPQVQETIDAALEELSKAYA